MNRAAKTQTVLLLTGLICAFAALVIVDGLLVSLILALVINSLFSPIVDALERNGMSRHSATAVPFAFGFLAVIIAFTLVLPLAIEQMKALSANAPILKQRWTEALTAIEVSIAGSLGLSDPLDLFARFNSWLLLQTGQISEGLPQVVSQSLTVLLLSPFFAYFLLADGNRLSRAILKLVPNPYFETTLNLKHQLNIQLGGFIRARLIESGIVGVIIWIGLSAIGFPYTVILSVAAAVANLIPYVGPVIGAIPALAIALFSSEATAVHGVSSTFGLVGLVYLIAQVVDTVFVIPLLVARIVNLHPVTVVVSILVGAEAYGVIGMVIAIPVASAVKLILQAIVPLTNSSRPH